MLYVSPYVLWHITALISALHGDIHFSLCLHMFIKEESKWLLTVSMRKILLLELCIICIWFCCVVKSSEANCTTHFRDALMLREHSGHKKSTKSRERIWIYVSKGRLTLPFPLSSDLGFLELAELRTWKEASHELIRGRKTLTITHHIPAPDSWFWPAD